MAATNAAALAASAGSPPRPEEISDRPRLSAVLLLLRFAAVAAVLLAAASFPQSAFFTIRDVSIEGTARVAPAELLARARLTIGAPVSFVSPQEIARLIGADPRIASAAVSIAPSGRILIRVTERIPVAVVAYHGRFVEVDPRGIAIVERADAGGLPVIATDGADPAWMRLGTTVPSPAVPDSIALLSQLPSALPRAGLRLRRNPSGELSIMTADRIAVRLGRIPGLAERAALLPEILATVRARGLAVDYVDLRFADNVILKPASGQPATDGAGAGTKR